MMLADNSGSWSAKLLMRAALLCALVFCAFGIVELAVGISWVNGISSSIKYTMLQYDRIRFTYIGILSERIGRQNY